MRWPSWGRYVIERSCRFLRGHVRMVGACVLLGIGIIGLAGCGKQPVAKVGSHTITRQEFLDKLEKDQGRDALVGMINRQLLEDAFDKSGLKVAPTEVQSKLAEFKKRFGSDQAFAQAMAAQGMAEEDVIESIELDQKMRALLTKDVKVNEAELKKWFEDNKPRFSKPATVSYAEIVVSTAEEANKVAAEAAKQGANFEALAKQHSISAQSREMGGQLPPMPEESIYPPTVRDALSKLAVGKISSPIEADGQWYILKLNGKTAIPPEDEALSPQTASVEEAVALGADAVGYTLYVGSPRQDEDFIQFTDIRDDAERLGIPVIVWAYPRGASVENKGGRDSLYAIDYAARVACELGADLVKLNMPRVPAKNVGAQPAPYDELQVSPQEALDRIVASAGKTMVLISGGSKLGDEDLLLKADMCMKAGATGLIFGRNMWQRKWEDALAATQRIHELLARYGG